MLTIFSAAAFAHNDPDDAELFRTPEVRPATAYSKYDVEKLQSILLEALPAPNGEKTFVFAYFALPDGDAPKGGFPAVVLQHGNTDTCFPMIAKKWRDRGYAVISYDHYGNLPETSAHFMKRPVVAESLQAKLNKKFNSDAPNLLRIWERNIWCCASSACTFLRSQKEINPDRIFLIGVSLGAANGLFTAARDPRFAGYVCCYGCGFFDHSTVIGLYGKDGGYVNDPQTVVGKIKMPVLWIVGVNDFAFSQINWQMSVDHTLSTDNQACIPGLTHGGWAANYPLACRWIDHLCGRDSALPKLGRNILRQNRAFAPILNPGDGITRAQLCYTLESRINHETVWKTLPATVENSQVSAELPAGTTAYFFTATDRDYPDIDMPVSSPFTQVK